MYVAVVVLLTCIARIWWTRYILSLIFPVVCRKKRREEMKWGKKNTRLSTALGRELLWPFAYSVLGVVVAVGDAVSAAAAAVAATHCYLYTIRILYNTNCALHILTTNTFIRRNVHTVPTATIIRAVHTSSDRVCGRWCCCCRCTDRITNTHAVDKLLGVFFSSFPYISLKQHSHLAAQPRHRE